MAMNRLLTGFTVFLALQSCTTYRTRPEEEFLLNTKQNRLMILSALPANDSTDVSVSSIFVSSFDSESGQSMVFMHAFSRGGRERKDGRFFIDSLMAFRKPGFPVLLAPAERDSVPAFRFFMSRRKAVLETGLPTDGETAYTLRYATQRPFETTSAGTAFGISGVVCLPATLENVAGKETRQSSLLSVHCLNSSEQLFLRDRSWYWIDCISGGKAFHIFFEAHKLGETRIHYSTFPSDCVVEVASAGAITVRSNETTLLIKTVSGQERAAKNSFRAEAVELIQEGVRTGSGILYKL
jgi:hypothetical protein